MSQKTICCEGGISFCQFIAIGKKLSATGQLPNRVLKTRQSIGLHLGPIKGDVGEMFHIHLEMGKGRIGGLHGPQILLALMASLGFSSELVFSKNAVNRIVANFEFKFLDPNTMSVAEIKKLTPELRQLLGFNRRVPRDVSEIYLFRKEVAEFDPFGKPD